MISYTEGSLISDDGEYELTVTDEAGNTTLVEFSIDSESPVVSFTPKGSTIFAKEYGIQINVKDNSNILSSELKYYWSTSDSNITEND